MPLYEVTLEQEYFGQQCINRWNYQSGAIPSGSSGAFLAVVGMGAIADDDTEAFAVDTVLGKLRAQQSTSVVFVQMIAKNIYSDTDFFTYAFPSNTRGLNEGDGPMSPMAAAGLASDRTRADIRRAQKRFVGLTEEDVGDGGVFPPTALASWQALGTIMGNPNTVTFDDVTTVFTPYVFGREKYHPEGKTTWAYRYYPTEAEQLEHIAKINNWTAKPQIRSQNSRQYGRGS